MPVGSVAAGDRGYMVIAGSVLWVVDADTTMKRSNGAFPGTWTSEDPQAGEAAQVIADIASSGSYIFAALGTNGIHRKDCSSMANPWTHYGDAPAGGYSLCEWVKDRLIACSPTAIYEIAAGGAAPSPLETLATGWTWRAIGENGEYIYAVAASTTTWESRIHHYGLNSSGNLVKIGSTVMPRGYVANSLKGYLDVLYITAVDSGDDLLLFQGFPGTNGELRLVLAQRGAGPGGAGPIETLGDHIVVGWSHTTPAGENAIGNRIGLAHYHLGREAFSETLQLETADRDAASSYTVADVKFFSGRLCFFVPGSGMFYEDTSAYITTATLISSIADWGSAGVKSWDRSRLSMRPLPSTAQVTMDHTTDTPEEGDWTDSGTQATSGETTLNRTHRTTEDPTLAVRIRSTAATGGATAPEILSFEVRSNPKPEDEEFRIVKTVRIFPKDRKDDRAKEVFHDTEAIWSTLRNKLYTWVTIYERGITWTARLERLVLLEPFQPRVTETLGEKERTAYVVQMTLVGTVAA